MRLFFIVLFSFSFTVNSYVLAQQPQGELEEKELIDSIIAETDGDKVNQEMAKFEGQNIKSTFDSSIIEIKRLDLPEELYSFELRDADLRDIFRVLARDYKVNLLVDKEVKGHVTASFNKVSLQEAIREIAESQNLILERKRNIVTVKPNLITKIFSLKYIEAKMLLGGSGKFGAVQSGQVSTIFDLLSEAGKALLGSMPNSIMIIDYPPNISKIEAYLNEVDKKMERRVFKMRYLKASELLGEKSADKPDDFKSGLIGRGE